MKIVKMLGLGLVMSVVLSATMAVASASASNGLLAGEYGAYFGATPEWGYFEAENGTQCEYRTTLEGSNASPSSQTNMEVVSVGKPPCGASVLMNGCRYEFNVGQSTWGIGPSTCGPVKIMLPICPVVIKPQNGLAASYTNATTKTVSASVSNVLKAKECGISSWFYYSAGWNIKAYNGAGNETGVQVAPIP